MDSDMMVREVSLGDDGIDYVRWRLSTGGPLAQVLRHIDLNAGSAVTFLPNRHPIPPTKLQEGGDLTAGDAEPILRAGVSKIMGHFAAAKGRGWALSEDRYDMGLGRYVGRPNEGRGTRVQLASVGDRGVYYLVDPVESSDVEDFLNASTVRANVGALGVGGIDGRDLSAADWETEVLPSVTNNVRLIIVEAFDELGFVYWKGCLSRSRGVNRPGFGAGSPAAGACLSVGERACVGGSATWTMFPGEQTESLLVKLLEG